MDSKNRFQEILRTLEKAHPGQIYLSVEEVARARGEAKGTIYNKISRKSKCGIGIPVVRIGNRPKFRIHDVARALAEL